MLSFATSDPNPKSVRKLSLPVDGMPTNTMVPATVPYVQPVGSAARQPVADPLLRPTAVNRRIESLSTPETDNETLVALTEHDADPMPLRMAHDTGDSQLNEAPLTPAAVPETEAFKSKIPAKLARAATAVSASTTAAKLKDRPKSVTRFLSTALSF